MTMQPVSSDPKHEFLNALYPLRRITWIDHFIKNLKQSHVNMPMGENASTERFIVSAGLCFCLFVKNKSQLMKYGKSLKKYINKYAAETPYTEAPLVQAKLSELMNKFSK
ncbi:MAG: hypothetical protein K0R24_1020 [Gammaproteobacteria bacterium]|nr:hypothetical protein [Gammaproteobacteria bacterium]